MLRRLTFPSTTREKIDVLANVAGIMDSFASAETYTDVEFSRVMNINLNVPTQMIRAVLPHMKSNGGSIINVGSKASLSGASAGVAYTASKHALVRSPSHGFVFRIPVPAGIW